MRSECNNDNTEYRIEEWVRVRVRVIVIGFVEKICWIRREWKSGIYRKWRSLIGEGVVGTFQSNCMIKWWRKLWERKGGRVYNLELNGYGISFLK